MKRLTNILYLLAICILLLTGCNNEKKSEQLKEVINNTVYETEEDLTSNYKECEETPFIVVAKNTGRETVEISEELRVDIEVYVNDKLMDVIVYKNIKQSQTTRSDNLTDFTLAKPIMEFLGITYSVDEENDIITLTSDRYGNSYRPYSTYAIIVEDDLYIPFSFFNLHTNGSLKQEDSSAMYLYTCDYERMDIPTTLEECYTMLDEELSDEDIELLRNSSKDDRNGMHFGFGMWIRNKWIRPTQSKVTKLLDENGVMHTDDMSSIIIEGYYRYLNDKPCSLEELLLWYFDE